MDDNGGTAASAAGMETGTLSRVVDTGRHLKRVVWALFDSVGIRWYMAGTFVALIATLLVAQQFLSGVALDVVADSSGAAVAFTGGFLWIRRPPQTFEKDPMPAVALLLTGAATILATCLSVVGTHYSLGSALSQIAAIASYVTVIMFFITARPRVDT